MLNNAATPTPTAAIAAALPLGTFFIVLDNCFSLFDIFLRAPDLHSNFKPTNIPPTSIFFIHLTKDKTTPAIRLIPTIMILKIILILSIISNNILKNEPLTSFNIFCAFIKKLDDVSLDFGTLSNRRFLSSKTFSNFFSNGSFFLKRPPKIFLPIPAANTLVAAVISASPPNNAAAPIAFRPVVIFGISISCSVFCSLLLFFEMIK